MKFKNYLLTEAAVDKDGIPIEDLNGKPIKTNRDGTINLYHATLEGNAKALKNRLKNGSLKNKERSSSRISLEEEKALGIGL